MGSDNEIVNYQNIVCIVQHITYKKTFRKRYPVWFSAR